MERNKCTIYAVQGPGWNKKVMHPTLTIQGGKSGRHVSSRFLDRRLGGCFGSERPLHQCNIGKVQSTPVYRRDRAAAARATPRIYSLPQHCDFLETSG